MIVFLSILDQFSKWFVFERKPNFDVIGDFLRIQYAENTGTIFGLLKNTNLVFIVLGIVLCVIIAFYMKKHIPKRSFKEKGFFLILAGGIGNLIDRIFRGFVIDFISLKWVGIFNLADMYIVMGVILILFIELREFWKDGDADRKSDFRA